MHQIKYKQAYVWSSGSYNAILSGVSDFCTSIWNLQVSILSVNILSWLFVWVVFHHLFCRSLWNIGSLSTFYLWYLPMLHVHGMFIIQLLFHSQSAKYKLSHFPGQLSITYIQINIKVKTDLNLGDYLWHVAACLRRSLSSFCVIRSRCQWP